jgi:hypothetical protein
MDTDKIACAELIQSWGFARDQGHWDDLNAIMHPGGEIAVSWFRGPYTEFVNHCSTRKTDSIRSSRRKNSTR